MGMKRAAILSQHLKPASIASQHLKPAAIISQHLKPQMAAAAIRSGMTASDKYLFDLQGFLVLRGVLSPEEVEAANAAIDHFSAKGELMYRVHRDQIYNPLLACSVQLSDHPAGKGGFVVVPGSHKANFPTPMELVNGQDELADGVLHQPVTKAGDVVLFSEGTVHGARAWQAEHERRIAIYRFAPATCAYGRAYLQWPEGTMDGLTPGQRAVLQPPHANRLDRECIEANGEITLDRRAAFKREWDEVVFENQYF